MNSISFLLPADEVHVWAVWLKASAAVSRTYRALLAPEEISHADRFAFERLSRSYEISQGALRLLLARYQKCTPRDVTFDFGPRKKPALRGNTCIRFNISHSGSLALYALTSGCEVGVDLEEIRPMPDIAAIASRYFCREEALQLLAVKGERSQWEAFFRCWTRKEAYIKAVGEGLYLPLDQFQVTLLADDPVRFVHIGTDARAAAGWTLQHLNPAANYVGALAYQAAARKIVFREILDTEMLLSL